jgi:peptide/nickel transport system substrate-binding protein
MRLSAVATFALASVVMVGCERSGSPASEESVGGSIVVSLVTDVGQVLPPLIQQVDEKTVADQIFEPLAWAGDEDRLDTGFRPALADGWAWERDSMVVVFHLNPRARWHDGAPVRASDVRFTHSLYSDPTVGSPERPALARIDSVTVRDSVTAVFWFNARYPEQFYDAAMRMLIVPEHLLAKEPRATLQTAAFVRSPVGSGRFRLAKWTSSGIELVADTANYHGRAKLDRVVFVRVTDADAVVAGLSSGELDAGEVSRSEQYKALAARPDLRSRMLPAWDYIYVQFNLSDRKRRNQPNRLFANPALRRALAMAVDRDKLIKSQFDSMAAVSVGPMTRSQPMADTTLPSVRYDSAGAARMLDSLGWKLPAGKTVREKAGQPLEFTVMVPSISGSRMALATKLQAIWGALGVKMIIDPIDAGIYTTRLNKRDFDVSFNGVHPDASISGLRAYWSSASANDPVGQNAGNYRNATFDAHLDSALAARDAGTARIHAKQAYTAIIGDVPAVWMYEPRTAQFVHKRIHTAHVAPTAWWRGLADWSIPAGERIPRDQIGLKVASSSR